MRQFLKTKKGIALGLVAALAIVGTAIAYWTTSGTGTGSATTGTDTAVTVSQVGSVSGLVPDGDAQAVDFKITNPASTPQYVSSVAVSIADGWSEQADSGLPACTADDFTIVQPDAIDSDLSSGDHTYSSSGATIAMKDTASNQDNCKNVTVDLVFDAS